jgi:hypothetical protein
MRFRPSIRPAGPALALALLAASLGIVGSPASPVSASCVAFPLIPPVEPGDSLFVGTVVATDPSGVAVRVDRWLVGPEKAGLIVVRGRFSLASNTMTSIDWEPAVGTSQLIAATPDERGVLQTSDCRVAPLTPEVMSAIDLGWPSASPSPAPSSQPISSSVEDETFRLTITTARSMYTTTDAIPISATLELLRTEPTTTAGSGSGPVVFGVEQLDGPVDAGPFVSADCVREDWLPDEVRVLPFTKSGGFDTSDPMAPFWTGYFNDPDLVLPPGHYRVFAVVDYDLDDCSVADSILTAEVRFEVVDPTASASPAA